MTKPELLDRQSSIAKTDIVMVTNENNVTKAITGQNLKKDFGAVGRVLICNSIESTAEKVVTGPDITLEAGISFRIVFAAGNTAANMTINYNSSEAKAVKIYRDGTKVTPDLTSMQVGAMLEVYYDGTDFVIISGISDVVEDGNMQAVTSNAVFDYVDTKIGSIVHSEAGLVNFEDYYKATERTAYSGLIVFMTVFTESAEGIYILNLCENMRSCLMKGDNVASFNFDVNTCTLGITVNPGFGRITTHWTTILG